MHTSMLVTPRTDGRHAAGFTLVELMITVVIVAILTSIALPAYRNYVIRGQLVSATSGLSAVQANMERYFQDNRTYLAANNYTPPCLVVPAPTYGLFQITCLTLTANSFQLQALGSGSVAAFSFFIDQQGNQWSKVTGAAPAGWTNCTTAWETKQGQCCTAQGAC